VSDIKYRSRDDPEPRPAAESADCPQDCVQQRGQWQEDEAEQREDESVERSVDLSGSHNPVDEERESWREATDDREQTAHQGLLTCSTSEPVDAESSMRHRAERIDGG